MAKRRRFDFGSVAERAPVRDSAVRILRQETAASVLDLDMAKAIPVELVDPDPQQFRRHFDEQALGELAQNILAQGVLQPIIVEWVAETNRFRVIAGERRRRALLLAAEWQAADPSRSARDLSRIPAIVRDATLIERCVQQVSENESRQDYSDVERAYAYERLKELLGITWEELAAKLGLSRMRLHQIRSTKNRLAPAVQDDITQRHITERQARKLVLLPPPAQETVAAAIKEHALTQQQTETLVQRVRKALATTPPAPPERMAAADGGDRPAAGDPPTAAAEATGEAAASAGTAPSADGRPAWLRRFVTRTVQEVKTAPAATKRTDALASTDVPAGGDALPGVPERADLAALLAWIDEGRRFDGLAPGDATERERVVAALEGLLARLAALRDRLRAGT